MADTPQHPPHKRAMSIQLPPSGSFDNYVLDRSLPASPPTLPPLPPRTPSYELPFDRYSDAPSGSAGGAVGGGLSPVTDRSNLVGLGELATPRWTSSVLERRWVSPSDERGSKGGEDLSTSGRRRQSRRSDANAAGELEDFDPRKSFSRTDSSTSASSRPPVSAGVAISPTLSRPSTRTSATTSSTNNNGNLGASGSSYLTNSTSNAPYFPNSMSTSFSSASLLPAATGMIDFTTNEPSSYSPKQPFDDVRRRSSAYSLRAISASDSTDFRNPGDDSKDSVQGSEVRAEDVPRRWEGGSKRKSFFGGMPSSAPTSAPAGGSWTTDSARSDIVGLGFDYGASSSGGAEAVIRATEALAAGLPTHRRVSSTSLSSSRRSSGSVPRPLSSSDPKSSKASHHRRQSASKSGFAHLPPSPAASTVTHPPPEPIVPVPPITFPTPSSPALPVTPAAATRTPDLSRHSYHAHHSSPSIVSAAILRQTREMELGALVDIDDLAAADEGTAEALRKLDGLSSPRMSKTLSSSAAPSPRSRTSSREQPPVAASEETPRTKRRARSSTSGSSVVQKDVEAAMQAEKVPSVAPNLNGSTIASPQASPAPPSTASLGPKPALVPSPIPRSPLSPQLGRLAAQPRPGSEGAYEVPFPTSSTTPASTASSSSAVKRGSSSSASVNRDSTSATSLSNSSVAARSTGSYKNGRRGSASSDVSSTPSSGDAVPVKVDWIETSPEGEATKHIPPVPPIPKDWEAYRPSTAGPSPRLEPFRRPSDSSSVNNDFLSPSPRAPDMESSISSSSSILSATKTPTRKWSISNAFSSKGRSPKPTSIKESASYSDLASTASQARGATYASGMVEPVFPRRLAASSNDIVGLAGGRDDRESTRTRASIAGDSRLSSSLVDRTRTLSMSSNSTARTFNTNAGTASSASTSQVPTPTVVTTSPGRSRSSLLSPRRTPSGIPFFSRKSSATSTSSAKSVSPSFESEQNRGSTAAKSAEKDEDRSGRKSIMGLNFLRTTASRREKEKAAPPPAILTKRQTISTTPSARPADHSVDEFGRRASAAAPSSSQPAPFTSTSLTTRKRGKTLPSSGEEPSFAVKPVSLPPMQMSALSAATVKRVDSLNSNRSTSSSSKVTPGPTSRIQPPSSRTAKLQESVKGNLPSIAGSPSTHVFPLVKDRETAKSASNSRVGSREPSPRSDSPPAPSQTPTKIPRLQAPRTTLEPTPRLRTQTSDISLSGSISPATIGRASRRTSLYSSANTVDTEASRLNSSLMSSSASSMTLGDETTSDFGPVREPGLQLGEKTLSTRRRLDSEPSGIPRSRSAHVGAPLAARSTQLDSSTSSAVTPRVTTGLPRATRRQSLMVTDDNKSALNSALSSSKSSTAPSVVPPRTSVSSAQSSRSGLTDSASSTSLATVTGRRPLSKPLDSATSGSRKTSASSVTEPFASSKSSRSLASKAAIPSRMSKSATTGSLSPAPTVSSGRSSVASSYTASEEEIRGDEEMAAYVRRQQAQKIGAGISPEVVRKMFEFPDPTEPLPALDAQDALTLFSQYLTEYEKKEILSFDNVYFVGPKCDKKPASEQVPLNNFGYDDERGDYLVVPSDHILYRYEVVDVLGKGSFGQVLQCRDHRTGEMVAIKIIRNKKRFHHQALVEIKVLENLVKWDPDEKYYVIRMVESFTFRGHLCIVTELLSINLYELVKANNFVGFTTTLIRRFTIQILQSLILLRQHRVVHCDLKPENILLKHPAKSAIKVIDFGSSCFETEKVYTYIQSRFYRSPEVILGMNYHMAIDMWSLGCIIAEMFTGYPIFPGENEQEQLACIMEVMGLPDKGLVDKSSRKRLFFDSTGAPRPVVNSKGRRRYPNRKSLTSVLKTTAEDELFVDFIAQCLAWNPESRLKPEQAMKHPWITQNQTKRRALSPTIVVPSSRTSRSSASVAASSSSTASSVISSPRRKVGSSVGPPTSVMATPSHSSASNVSGAATAPVQRTRTVSTASSVPRLHLKGSLALPGTSTRYSLKS